MEQKLRERGEIDW